MVKDLAKDLKSENLILYAQALEILGMQAQEFFKKNSLPTEKIKLENSVGRILSQDVFSKEDLPAFDNSAMDGFCVNSEYVNSALKNRVVELPVVASLAAGDVLDKLQDIELSPACAIEIMTGAPFPSKNERAHFDFVIKVEDVVPVKNTQGIIKAIQVTQPLGSKSNVRSIGEDFKKGQLVLKKGEKILTQHLLALAGLGIFEVEVYKSIEIALLATGEELVAYNQVDLASGKIRNSTALYLEKWFAEKDFKVKNYGIIGDDEDQYQAVIKKSFADGAQVFISTGAVSQGKFDFVKSVLEKMGVNIHFHKCAIRPGKPILFGSLNYKGQLKFIFGIPGNPVATAIAARFFVLPFLQKLQSEQDRDNNIKLDKQLAMLSEDFKKPQGLRCFFKAQIYQEKNQLYVRTLSGQSSFQVQPLLESNAWVVFPEQNNSVQKGTVVEVYNL